MESTPNEKFVTLQFTDYMGDINFVDKIVESHDANGHPTQTYIMTDGRFITFTLYGDPFISRTAWDLDE